MSTMRRVLILFLLPLSSGSLTAQPTPAGDEFQVNAYTTDDQEDPDVAKQANGDFMVVWRSGSYFGGGSDGDRGGISARLFASDGSSPGGELQVNSYTDHHQQDPKVAATLDGGFLVVWSSYGSPGTDFSSSSIQARRFAADGTAVADQFQVNTYTTDRQRAPAFAIDADGDFVVVWEDLGFSYPFDGQDGSGSGVVGLRLASDGSVLGGEFQVNTYTTGRQYRPAVAVGASGGFLVAWQSAFAFADSFESIQAQRYDSDGNALGGQFQVNMETLGQQAKPLVAALPDGGYLVGWVTTSDGVRAQRYAKNGTLVGVELTISTSASVNDPPAAGIAENGDLFFAWSSQDVTARRFASDGGPLGDELLVNTYTTGVQNRPAIAVEPGGGFVVAWTNAGYGSGPDGDGSAIAARRFLGSAIFADGFESGDTTSWSSRKN